MNDIRLMSFDIGIKNMAYCTFIFNKDDINISDWSILDIAKNNEKNIPQEFTCSCASGKKIKICGKKAQFEKLGLYYCGIHAKTNKDWIIPIQQNQYNYLKKMKKDDLVNVSLQYSIIIPNDTKINKQILLDAITSFFLEKCFIKLEKHKEQNAGDINLIILGRNMKRLLDKTQGLDKVTHVILENQISPIASRMKTIQGMLAQYFIMRFGDEIQISFVSSSNKLKMFPITTTHENTSTDNKYKQHKTDAILHTINILKTNTQLVSWSDKMLSNKKDDLADCFLQGIWYLKKEKYISMNDIYNIQKINE